jgi:AcrR family transcriptional regulator
MNKDLKVRKQELVRDAIYDAAINLFVKNGFSQITIDQIAEAAGISQRSFFRYFATKGDLLGYTVAEYGNVLVSAVGECAAGTAALEMIRDVASAGIKFSLSQPRTRDVIQIASKDLAARQAQRASLVEVDNRLAKAFAARAKNASEYDLEPRMMAAMTMMFVDLSLATWFMGEAKDSSVTIEKAFRRLNLLFSESKTASDKRVGKATKRSRTAPSGRRELLRA